MRTTSLFALLTLNMAATAGGIDRDSALQALQQPDVVLIDVRTAEEFAEGALPGATRIETAELAHNIEALAPRKDTPVVRYCRSGRRSSAAQEVLEKLGYSQVINAGGYDQLASALQRD